MDINGNGKNKILKVDEWKTPSGHYYVADVHTWSNWRACAEVLGVKDSISDFIKLLENKYNAIIDDYYAPKDFLLFYWDLDHYKDAHQFKLDVNRIARKKNYLVERSF